MSLTEIDAEHSHLHTLFMQAPAIIAVSRGPEHVLELANPRFQQLVGYRNVIGKPLREALPELADQGYLELIDSVYTTGESFIGNELPARIDRRGDGVFEESFFNFVLHPIRNTNGTVTGLMAYAVEVTEQVLMRRRLEQLAAEKDAFLSAVAHDLKSPLTTVKALAQMLQRRLSRGEDLETGQVIETLARIDATTTRMTALINELLDVARLRMGQSLDLDRQRMDLVVLARRVAAEQQGTTEHHSIRVAAMVPELIGAWDEARLERVLTNLVSNAIKYSPEGGDITVTATREESGPKSWAVLSVRDQGVGIPAANLPHIFEWFQRGDNVVGQIAGTGIGLPESQRIVEQHGGTITAESQEGIGSTFTVRLPLDKTA
jgi:PAS domain S-box-containing protein